MGRAPDVTASSWISRTGVSGRLRRQFCGADGARCRAESRAAQIGQSLEPGRREINETATTERNGYRGSSGGQRDRGQGCGVASHHVHLVLVHLYEIET